MLTKAALVAGNADGQSRRDPTLDARGKPATIVSGPSHRRRARGQVRRTTTRHVASLRRRCERAWLAVQCPGDPSQPLCQSYQRIRVPTCPPLSRHVPCGFRQALRCGNPAIGDASTLLFSGLAAVHLATALSRKGGKQSG